MNENEYFAIHETDLECIETNLEILKSKCPEHLVIRESIAEIENIITKHAVFINVLPNNLQYTRKLRKNTIVNVYKEGHR